MEYIYYLILGLGLIGLVILIFKKIRPWWKKLLAIALSLVVILFSGINIIFPVYDILPVTGPFEIDTTRTYVNYTPSDSNYTTSGNERQVPLSIWQPEDLSNANGFSLIYSHGSFGVEDANDSLFNELASHGYIVLSIGHPYHSFTTQLEDGRNMSVDMTYLQEVMATQGSDNLEEALTDMRRFSKLHEDDLGTVLDSIEKQENEPIFNAINKEQIILMGHSLGGTSASILGRQRDDVLAVITLEAPLIGEIKGLEDDGSGYVLEPSEYPVPILNIYSDATWDVISADELNGWELYGQNHRQFHENNPKYENVHIAGAGHIGLTDMVRVSPILVNVMDGGLNVDSYQDNLSEINQAILEFVEQVRELES